MLSCPASLPRLLRKCSKDVKMAKGRETAKSRRSKKKRKPRETTRNQGKRGNQEKRGGHAKNPQGWARQPAVGQMAGQPVGGKMSRKRGVRASTLLSAVFGKDLRDAVVPWGRGRLNHLTRGGAGGERPAGSYSLILRFRDQNMQDLPQGFHPGIWSPECKMPKIDRKTQYCSIKLHRNRDFNFLP